MARCFCILTVYLLVALFKGGNVVTASCGGQLTIDEPMDCNHPNMAPVWFGDHPRPFTCGGSRPYEDLITLPRIKPATVKDDAMYAMFIVNPDWYQYKKGFGLSYLHYAGAFIKGSALSETENGATVLMKYLPPNYQRVRCLNRYFIYVYEIPEGVRSMTGIYQRDQFTLNKYAIENNLCGPIALNFFFSKFLDFEPEMEIQNQ